MRPLILPPRSGPDHSDINQAGKDKVRRQTILRHFDAIGETGSDHPPPDRALQRAKSQDHPQASATIGRNPAAPQKPHEGQKENYTNETAKDPVRPLPPENGLKIGKTHSSVQ